MQNRISLVQQIGAIKPQCQIKQSKLLKKKEIPFPFSKFFIPFLVVKSQSQCSKSHFPTRSKNQIPPASILPLHYPISSICCNSSQAPYIEKQIQLLFGAAAPSSPTSNGFTPLHFITNTSGLCRSVQKRLFQQTVEKRSLSSYASSKLFSMNSGLDQSCHTYVPRSS